MCYQLETKMWLCLLLLTFVFNFNLNCYWSTPIKVATYIIMWMPCYLYLKKRVIDVGGVAFTIFIVSIYDMMKLIKFYTTDF